MTPLTQVIPGEFRFPSIDLAPLPEEGGGPVAIWPIVLGGVNMYPNSFNPKTGNLYLAATNAGMKYGFEESKVISNVRHFGAYQAFIWGNEVGKAVNVQTGAELWRNVMAKPGPMTFANNGKQFIVQGLGGTPGFGRDEAWKAEYGRIVEAFTLERSSRPCGRSSSSPPLWGEEEIHPRRAISRSWGLTILKAGYKKPMHYLA